METKDTHNLQFTANMPLASVQANFTEQIQILDKKYEDKFKAYEERQASEKNNLITVFGVFASIVTFLSAEIQILARINDYWKVLGFSFIVLSSLLLFVLVLDYLGKGWVSGEKISPLPYKLLVLIGFIFLIGLVLSAVPGFERLFYQNQQSSAHQCHSREGGNPGSN